MRGPSRRVIRAASARSFRAVTLAAVVLPISGALLGSVAASAMLAGCKGCDQGALDHDTRGQDGGHATSASLTPEQSAKVLARVGDKTITLGDYVATLEHMDQFDRLRYQSPERRKELLNEMITIELLAGEARAKGYDKDPQAQQDQRNILRDALLVEARKGAETPDDIPEAEVRAYYDAHRADYRDPERRRASVVVLKDEATANGVLDQAKKTTTAAQWGEIVRAKSIDAQAKANVPIDLAGDFGMVSPPDDTRGESLRVPQEVRVALFAIPQVGGIYDHVVQSGDKFYVVRLAQKADAHDRAFAEADRGIRVKLTQDKLHAREEDLLKTLRAQYPVQIDDNVLGQVRVDLGDAGAD